jgi:tetraacyldisaccharide-1-P 4'-kinase
MNRFLASLPNWPIAFRLPLAGLHALGLRAHQGWLRREQIRGSGSIAPTLPCLVVGALRLSGSGKSTVTAEIASKAGKHGIRVAILCYRRPQDWAGLRRKGLPSFTDPMEVTDQTPWETASDEAVWLKKSVPEARVFVTRHRQKALEWLSRLSQTSRPDWVICDDGLWDPRIVTTHRWILGQPDEAKSWRELFPAGPYRGLTALTQPGDFWACEESERNGSQPFGRTLSASQNHAVGTFRRVTLWKQGVTPLPSLSLDEAGKNQAIAPGLLVCGHGNAMPMKMELERQGFRMDRVLVTTPHADLPLRSIREWVQGHPEAPLFLSPRDAVKITGLKNPASGWKVPFQWTWQLSTDLQVLVWVCSHRVVFSDPMNRWLETQAFPQIPRTPSVYATEPGVWSA